MSRLHGSLAFAVMATAVIGARGGAQGNLSTQGYGFPQGQLATHALAMGGSTGEIDPSSGLNPASIGLLTTRTVIFQIEPEFRKLTSAGGTDNTVTARYPLVSVGVPFGPWWVTSISSTSLLDRSWQTSNTFVEPVGGDSVGTNFHQSSNGAINDLRLAEAWSNRQWLYIGVGIHGITGRNVTTSGQDFIDTTFSGFGNSRTISYSGVAYSAGVQLLASGLGVLGFDYRKGGSLRARFGDSTLAKGTVPDHFGVSVAFTGITGTALSARVAHDGWSSMTQMLSSATDKAHDSWDLGVGGQFTGPKVVNQTLMLLVGARSRTLPFEAAGAKVDEKSVSFGTGVAFGGGRVAFDVAGVRQWRSSDLPGVTERAWTMSFGITARP